MTPIHPEPDQRSIDFHAETVPTPSGPASAASPQQTPQPAAAAHEQAVLDAGHLVHPERTLVEILLATAEEHPTALALEDAAGALSYRRLVRLVNEQAIRLSRAGVRRGDTVGIRIPSGTRELYLSILATLAVGAA